LDVKVTVSRPGDEMDTEPPCFFSDFMNSFAALLFGSPVPPSARSTIRLPMSFDGVELVELRVDRALNFLSCRGRERPRVDPA
jgi:hypothetical protein